MSAFYALVDDLNEHLEIKNCILTKKKEQKKIYCHDILQRKIYKCK